MTTSTEPAPRSAKAGADAVAAAAPPATPLSLDDYLSREPRLAKRPEMTGAFARFCQRRKTLRATSAEYGALLTAFERGAY